jgi:hypothetical protein
MKYMDISKIPQRIPLPRDAIITPFLLEKTYCCYKYTFYSAELTKCVHVTANRKEQEKRAENRNRGEMKVDFDLFEE